MKETLNNICLMLLVTIASVMPTTLQAKQCDVQENKQALSEIGNYAFYARNLKGDFVYEGLIQAILDKKHICVIKALLNDPIMSRIDINADNELGVFPLLATIHRGDINTVKLLLEIPDVDINNRGSSLGSTALMDAAHLGHLDILKELIKTPGIRINARSGFGMTALMNASSEGHPEVVRELLNVPGINITLKDVSGYTALDMVNEILSEYDKFELHHNEKHRVLFPKYKQIAEILKTAQNNR